MNVSDGRRAARKQRRADQHLSSGGSLSDTHQLMWLGINDVNTGTVGVRPLPTSIPGDSASENACRSIGQRAVLRSQDVQLLPAEPVEVTV
jgi:hypothetical protein